MTKLYAQTGSAWAAMATAAVDGAPMIEGAAASSRVRSNLGSVFDKLFAAKNKMPIDSVASRYV